MISHYNRPEATENRPLCWRCGLADPAAQAAAYRDANNNNDYDNNTSYYYYYYY